MQESITTTSTEGQSPLSGLAGGQPTMAPRGSTPVANGTSAGPKSPSVLLPVAPPDPSVLGGRSQEFVKLFVGSVPRSATEDEIRDMFGEFGNLLEVAVIKNKQTGISQGCAFVKYGSVDDAERAIRSVNNSRCLPGTTAPVQVRYADGERERLANSKLGVDLAASNFLRLSGPAEGAIEHKLFVGSVSKQASETDVKELFAQYGHVEDVYVMRDDQKHSRGCCFVKYSSRESAMNAINALNGLYTMMGSDQPMAVRFADPKKPKGVDMQGFGGSGFRPRGSPFGTRPGMQGPGGRSMGQMDGGRAHMWRSSMGGPGIGGQMGPGPNTGPMGPGGPMGGPMGPRMMAGPMGGLAGPLGVPGGPMGGPGGPMGAVGPMMGPHGPMGPAGMLHGAQPQQQQQPGMQQAMPQMMGGPGAGVVSMIPQPQHQQQAYYQVPPQQQGVPQQQPQPQPQQQMQQHIQQQMQQQMPQQQGYLQAPPSQQQQQQQPQQTSPQTQTQTQAQQQQPQQSTPLQQQGYYQTAPMQQQQPQPTPELQQPPQPFGPPPSCDWSEHTAPEGFKYYYNSVTGVSQWEKPPELAAMEQAVAQQQQQQQSQQGLQPMAIAQYAGVPMFAQASTQYAQQQQAGMAALDSRQNQIQGPPGANLFVFRIPDDFTDENLTQTFAPFGTVISARVGVEKESGRNRGFGFVSFDNATSAETAIQGLNGVTIGGRRLKVERKRGEENGSASYRPY